MLSIREFYQQQQQQKQQFRMIIEIETLENKE